MKKKLTKKSVYQFVQCRHSAPGLTREKSITHRDAERRYTRRLQGLPASWVGLDIRPSWDVISVAMDVRCK